MKYSRTRWMEEFERQAVDNKIYEHGKVVWDDAHYFWITGRTVDEAITILLRHKESEG